MNHQINTKIPEGEFLMLKALAQGRYARNCPTCGKEWDLNNQVIQDPIPPTTLASKLLIDAIRDAFKKAQL